MSPNLAFAPEGALMPNDRRTMLPLAAVIAVMCFLAALTLMAAVMISRAAADWNAGLATTATVQLMPGQGLELQSQAAAALDILRSTEGVAGAELMSLEETQALIEPWVGASDAIADLPMPRLITVRFAPGSTPEIANLAERIAKNVPGASLDTHIAWRDRLAVFAGVMSGLIYAVLLLITVAAVGAVVFATRAGMMAHHEIVEVLHLVGARDAFIANEFQRRFLRLGLEAGAAGTVLAALTLIVGGLLANGATLLGAGAFLPALDPGVTGYLWLILVPLGAACVSMVTARLTVLNALHRMI